MSILIHDKSWYSAQKFFFKVTERRFNPVYPSDKTVAAIINEAEKLLETPNIDKIALEKALKKVQRVVLEKKGEKDKDIESLIRKVLMKGHPGICDDVTATIFQFFPKGQEGIVPKQVILTSKMVGQMTKNQILIAKIKANLKYYKDFKVYPDDPKWVIKNKEKYYSL